MAIKVTINVTEEDIVNGVQGNECYCPVAKAIQRTLNDPTIRVGCQRVWNGNKIHAELPIRTIRWIEDYDVSMMPHVMPTISFDLEIYDQ